MCNILLNDGALASFPSICPKLCNNEVQCVLFWFFHAVFNMLRKMIQNGFKNSVSGPRSTYLPKQQMDNNQMVSLALISSWSSQRESSVSRFSAGRLKHLTFQEPVSAIHQVIPPTLTECWFYVTFLLFVIYNKLHFFIEKGVYVWHIFCLHLTVDWHNRSIIVHLLKKEMSRWNTHCREQLFATQ